MAYDNLRGLLYMTTASGTVARYDVLGQKLLSPLSIGNSLNGADITPDDAFLYVTEGVRGPTQGFVHKVDLDDGTVTELRYNLGGGEGGSWDIAIGGYGKAVVTTSFEGSGWTDLKEVDLSTGAFTPRRSVRQNTLINRGADRSLVFGQESNISNGPIFVYDAASGTFPASATTGTFIPGGQAAVSNDGSLIAMPFISGVSILSRNLTGVEVLPRLDGAVAFDPLQNVLYAVSDSGNQVVAFDTGSWKEKYRLDIGENVGSIGVFGNGVMRVSDDGTLLFVSTPSGVRILDLPASTGVATRLVATGFPTLISAGTPGTFTVTALDPAGNHATEYRGTVHFSTTDPASSLLPDYTFTGKDEGVHSFAVVFGTPGPQTVTIMDPDNELSASVSTVVHTDPITSIPVPGHRKLVYDGSRNMLFITTATGTVERYDVASQTLLAPFQIGASFYGADIAPDGNALYVAEGMRGATQGFIRKIDPDLGTLTNIGYPASGGAWAVDITNNGKAFIDSRVEGSGWVDLTEIDLQTGQLRPRRSVRQDTGLYRGANRGLLFGLEANISSGPIFTYDALTDSFPHSVDTSTFLDHTLAAINRDDSLIAMQFRGSLAILDRNLGSLRSLPGSSGMAFDPQQDLLYSAVSSQIVAYETTTWTEQFRLDIGEAVGSGSSFGNGEMAISDDGSLLFVATASGVRIVSLPGGSGPVSAHRGTGFVPAQLAEHVFASFTSENLMPEQATQMRANTELVAGSAVQTPPGILSRMAATNGKILSRLLASMPLVHTNLRENIFSLSPGTEGVL